MAEQLLNIKFVSEVEKYPCLYNYNMKEYSKKDITEKAWVAVGNAVNLSGWCFFLCLIAIIIMVYSSVKQFLALKELFISKTD